MKLTFAFGAIGLGFLLVAISLLWSTLFPANASWTTEKATRMSEIKAELNDLSAKLYAAQKRTYGGPDPGTMKVEYDRLLAEHEQLKVDFETISERPNTIARVCKWAGLSLAAIGVIGWYAAKQSD
jgi:hypothetical protein